MSVVETFSNSPGSVTKARRLATGELRHSAPEVRDIVEMLVSEIVTNCVRHTSSAFTVRIEVDEAKIRVDVTDQGGGRPQVRSPEPLEPSGRGLRIVEVLSDRWGVNALVPAGKTVWFEVANRGSASVAAPA